MAFFTIKKLKGKEYIFLEERGRVNGHIKRTYQKYIGPRELMPDIPIGKQKGLQMGDITVNKVFEFGLGAALWKIATEFDVPGIIDRVIGEQKSPHLSMGEYLTLAAINRADDPSSKTQLSTWFEKSWLSTRFNLDPKILNAQTYWNHFQRLSPEIFNQVELQLSQKIHQTFQLPLDRIFYDTTNIFSYSQVDDDNGLRHFGHSKQNQNGLPLINYYLLCSKPYGIPVLHHTYAGNNQDAETFKTVPADILEHLQHWGLKPDAITLCFDKGNLSPKGMGEIARTNLKFIASLRNSTQKDLLHIPQSQFETITLPISKKTVKYWRIQREVYGSARIVYVVIDPAKQNKHQQQFQKKLEDKIVDIQDFTRTQVNVKKWREKANVEAKLRTLIGKKPWNEIIAFTVDGEYAKLQVQLSINPTAKAAYEETLGRSILFTNQDSWKPEDVIWGYREQYLIEHAFRAMKDPRTIAIRPIYHANGKCIDAHIFVCLLALFLLSILRLKLSKRGVILTYDQIMSQLRRIHATQIKVTPTKEVCYKLEKIPINTIKMVKLLHLDRLIQED